MAKSRIEIKQTENQSCRRRCNKSMRKDTTEEDLCTEAQSVIDSLPVRCVGEWAIQKIYHLIQYFGIFTTGMKAKWEGNINYIEICSGPGRCINRVTGDEFNGTSLCIVEHEASKYLNSALFFDFNEKVIEAMNIRLQKRSINNAKALFGDYNDPAAICKGILKETSGLGLNLVFIDPTDCSVPFELLRKLKESLLNIDFIINFAIRTDVNRNIKGAILYPETHQNVIKKYILFLGSDKFFSRRDVIEFAKNGNQLELRRIFREEYMNSLRSIGFLYFDFKPIENYYDLVFATCHPKGIEFWQKANAIGYDGQRSLF